MGAFVENLIPSGERGCPKGAQHNHGRCCSKYQGGKCNWPCCVVCNLFFFGSGEMRSWCHGLPTGQSAPQPNFLKMASSLLFQQLSEAHKPDACMDNWHHAAACVSPTGAMALASTTAAASQLSACRACKLRPDFAAWCLSSPRGMTKIAPQINSFDERLKPNKQMYSNHRCNRQQNPNLNRGKCVRECLRNG